jgi:hypothetical protein
MDPVVRIPLGGDLFTVIDREDFTSVFRAFTFRGKLVEAAPCDLTWCLSRGTHCDYAKSFVRGVQIEMGRLVSSAPAGMHADHRDFDSLNNRRTNLRVCTVAQNLHARRYRRNGTGYRGVQKTAGGYMARIYVNNRDVSLGTYQTAEEAARVRDAKALELFGEFAQLNFPVQGDRPCLTK